MKKFNVLLVWCTLNADKNRFYNLEVSVYVLNYIYISHKCSVIKQYMIWNCILCVINLTVCSVLTGVST